MGDPPPHNEITGPSTHPRSGSHAWASSEVGGATTSSRKQRPPAGAPAPAVPPGLQHPVSAFDDAAEAAAGDCFRTPGRPAERERRIRRAAFDQVDGHRRAGVVQDRGRDGRPRFHRFRRQSGKEGQAADRRQTAHPHSRGPPRRHLRWMPLSGPSRAAYATGGPAGCSVRPSRWLAVTPSRSHRGATPSRLSRRQSGGACRWRTGRWPGLRYRWANVQRCLDGPG